MRNCRTNRIGRLLRFRFGFPVCPRLSCLSVFFVRASVSKWFRFVVSVTGFPASRTQNGRTNRIGRLLRFRFRFDFPGLSLSVLPVPACPCLSCLSRLSWLSRQSCLSVFFVRASVSKWFRFVVFGHRFSGFPDAELPDKSDRTAAPLPHRFPRLSCLSRLSRSLSRSLSLPVRLSCLSLPVRLSVLFVRAAWQQMVSLRCFRHGFSGFPDAEVPDKSDRTAAPLPLRFPRLSLSVPASPASPCFLYGRVSANGVRAATESPRRGGLPRSFTPPHTSGQGRVVTSGICSHGMCGGSGCVAARGSVGRGGKVGHSFPVRPLSLRSADAGFAVGAAEAVAGCAEQRLDGFGGRDAAGIGTTVGRAVRRG